MRVNINLELVTIVATATSHYIARKINIDAPETVDDFEIPTKACQDLNISVEQNNPSNCIIQRTIINSVFINY